MVLMDEEDKKKIKEAFQLQQFLCPHRGGMNYPCVVCKECRDSDLKQYPLQNGMVEITKNSSLISLLVDLKDPFDDMLLMRLNRTLNEVTGGIIQKEPEMGFSITFYITDNFLERIQNVDKIVDFIWKFPQTFQTETISAKSVMNKWQRDTSKRLIREMTVIF